MMKQFDYTQTPEKVEGSTDKVKAEIKVKKDKAAAEKKSQEAAPQQMAQDFPEATPPLNEAEIMAEPLTMLEAIEYERKKALSKENERHQHVLNLINAKFDELKAIERERELTLQKAVDKAEEDLKEIDDLITERRSGIFDEVKQIAQEFNARFNPDSK